MSRKQKSLWIINFFAGNRNSGWGERHFFLAKKLIQNYGYEVIIISSSFNHMFDRFPAAPKTFNFEEYEGVKFCWVKTPQYDPKSIMRFWAMLVFAAKLFLFPLKKLQSPKYILMSSMPLFPIISAWYLKKRLRAEKLIFEIRDLWPLTPVFLGDVSAYNPMILLMRAFEYFACKRADIILSLLPRAYLHIDQISKAPDKFFYLPNGISEDVITDEPLPFQLHEVIPQDKFIIGYAGTLGIANAMEYVVDAAKLLVSESRAHFVIIGEGYLKNELVRRAEGLNNITFISKVKKGQVSQVIGRFDVGIISWHNSSLYKYGVSANKFFDYMLAGKPVLVAGDLADNPVEKARCGVVVAPESPEAICQGIRELMCLQPETRIDLGINGRNYVKKYHTYDFLATRLNSLMSDDKMEFKQ